LFGATAGTSLQAELPALWVLLELLGFLLTLASRISRALSKPKRRRNL
jgi:hypothetical protein